MGMVWANFQGLCQLKVITKEHYSNFGSFEIATLLNVPGQYLRKYGTGTPLIGRILGPRKNRLNRNPSY